MSDPHDPWHFGLPEELQREAARAAVRPWAVLVAMGIVAAVLLAVWWVKAP